MTQRERVLRASLRPSGVSQVDFLAPDVCDGEKPITRLAARIFDLEREGYLFEVVGWRNRCKVYRLLDGPTPGPIESGAGEALGVSASPAPALFDVPVPAPVPHWRAA